MAWHKYSAKKVVIDGHKFDSKFEAWVYQNLVLKEVFGKLVELQPKVYMTKAKILMKPDFLLLDKYGKRVYLEAKGFKTPVFNLKARLWKHYGDGKLIVVQKSGKTYKITKEIVCAQHLIKAK
jgi:hypothetical protein